MRRLTIALAVVALSMGSAASEASSITFSYNAGDGCSGSSSVGSTFAATCTGTTLGAVTTVSSEASLDLLKLFLDSSGTFSGGQVPGATTNIVVRDTITVSDANQTGGGTLVWNWAFDGTLSSSDQFYSSLFMNGGLDGYFISCGSNVQFGRQFCPGVNDSTVNQTISVRIPFVFGVPLNTLWELQAVIASGCAFGNNCNTPQTGSGTVDFFNTLQLEPLIVLDSNGTQISGASVVSDSDFRYEVATTNSVPEPTSLFLLSTGGFGLILRLRRRKQQSS